MRLVYSRNRQPQPNSTDGMTYLGVRDEPARIVHVLNEERANVTICGAPIGDDPVPPSVVLTNCGNCFKQIRQSGRRRPPTWRLAG